MDVWKDFTNLNVILSGSSTLPRATNRGTETDLIRGGDKVVSATSNTSLYDNVASGRSLLDWFSFPSNDLIFPPFQTPCGTQSHRRRTP